MSAQVIVRIDPGLKNKVSHLAKAEGKNVSQIVRELLENYVKDRNISSYIDDLWDRINANLANKGIDKDQIESIIRQARTHKE